jgi:hypothetical protein
VNGRTNKPRPIGASVQAKEEKARQEVLFGARESYWNLVKAIQVEEIYQQGP